MDATALGQSLSRRFADKRDTAAALGLFAGSLFLSALLLFSVQPMFAKMVLPKLGGAPSVWAVSMCFFQAVLLAGYCYAHALNRFVPAHYAPLVHLALLAIAVLAQPIGLPAGAEPPAGDAYFWLIGTLALGVGLPFFAVSANAPLLQSWFARSGHSHAKDPYFLYGASNLGSLIALLAYPLVIEPFSGLTQQAGIWLTGFIVLGVAIAFCGLSMALNTSVDAGSRSGAARPSVAAPTWAERAGWIGLAFVPSGLLVAFTTYVTTDIASAPFLWVLPLAAFLGTFILVFKETPVIPHKWLLLIQPALVGGVLFGLARIGNEGWTIAVYCGTGAFFVTTMIAHRELYERRPSPERLTEFYLWMSFGGVLGGMFAALVAPQLFSVIWEFPLLLVLGIACRPGLFKTMPDEAERRELLMLTIGAFLLLTATNLAILYKFLVPSPLPLMLFLLAFCVATILNSHRVLWQVVFTALMAVTIAILPSAMTRGNAERSFFGVHRVTSDGTGEMRLLVHGTTTHGAERLTDASGNRVATPVAATYYYPGGPMARGADIAREVTGKTDGGLNAAVVGLGAGSMACNSRPNETWRFYEIDPVVVRIAQDPNRFTFLSRCRPNADIVVGDARLTLAKEPARGFDYLVIDAFSSDAVPIHLMTVEAMQLYLAKLSPDGLLALHVSNRHLDLASVVASVTASLPGVWAELAEDRTGDKTLDASSSQVVFISRSAASIEAVKRLAYVQSMPAADMPAWTDDYSDILRALWRKYN